MKTMETINAIVANMTESEFEAINNLDSEYWFGGMKSRVRKKLTRELKKHGLSYTEWEMWAAD